VIEKLKKMQFCSKKRNLSF